MIIISIIIGMLSITGILIKCSESEFDYQLKWCIAFLSISVVTIALFTTQEYTIEEQGIVITNRLILSDEISVGEVYLENPIKLRKYTSGVRYCVIFDTTYYEEVK